MTPLEAHAIAVESLRELESIGVVVRRTPSKSKDRPECVAKYSGPDRLPPHLWEHVSMFPVGEEQTNSITDHRKALNWRGIVFDTGGCAAQREWELDWSFQVKETPDGEVDARQDAVEEMIQGWEDLD